MKTGWTRPNMASQDGTGQEDMGKAGLTKLTLWNVAGGRIGINLHHICTKITYGARENYDCTDRVHKNSIWRIFSACL